MMRISVGTFCVIAGAAAVLACEHGGPFPPTNYTPSEPFNAPPLIRLSVNPGQDLMPAWLPDGSIVYTTERLDRHDHDRCLAFMPGTGGAITAYACRTTASNDSVDVFAEAAATVLGGEAGQLAYVRMDSDRLPVIPTSPNVQAIVVAPLRTPNAARVVRALPYSAPSGRTHWGITNLRWLDATHLAYIGQDVSYPRGCSSCPPDTLRVGLEIAVLDIAPAVPVVTIVPGTDSASSLAVGATSDTIFFTRERDSVVYRHVFSSSATDTVHNFGSGHLVRDVAWAAGRLFVVVDGQPDIGGDIHILGPGPGVDSLVPGPSVAGFVWYQRPSPSPDGRRFLAQGYAIAADSTVTSTLDVWLYELP
ncbi:MAG: hypothetical protein ABR537_02645 [Gemmatimonadales bacterium]